MFQMSLQFSEGKDNLKDYFEKMTGKSVSLTVTDNAASLLSIRPKESSVSVRMHWMFLNAGEESSGDCRFHKKKERQNTAHQKIHLRKPDLPEEESSIRQPDLRTQEDIAI
jgi:hypothetical protein